MLEFLWELDYFHFHFSIGYMFWYMEFEIMFIQIHSCRNFDRNNFNGILNMTNINTSHLVGEISLVNNSIIGLIPPWGSDTYSLVL
jgi:hypothetical protein